MEDLVYLLGEVGGALDVAGAISGALEGPAMILLLFGLIQACFGLKLFKIYCAIGGFFLGGLLGAVLGGAVAEDAGVAIVLGLICGILGALVAFKVYYIGVFLNVFAMGTILGLLLSRSIGLGVILGLLLAIVAMFFVKPVIIISSGLSGGSMASLGLCILIRQMGSATMLVFTLLIAVGGMFLQFHLERKKPMDTDGPSVRPPASAADSRAGEPYAAPVHTMPNVQAADVDPAHPRLNTLFAKEIYDELAYIFPPERQAKLLYLPEGKEDGVWRCSCGAEVSGETCRICGMTRTEADEIFNFSYLSTHRTERMRQEEAHRQELAEQRRQMVEQKKDALKKTAQSVASSASKGGAALRQKSTAAGKQFAEKASQLWIKVQKHKKIVFPVVGSLLVLVAVGTALFFNSSVRANYYNSKANALVAQDPGAAEAFYRRALEEEENPESYIGLARVAEETGALDQVGWLLSRGIELFPADAKMQAAYDSARPETVRFSVPGGTFTDLVSLELTTGHMEHGATIFYQIDSGEAVRYSDPILLNQPGAYRISAWTENDYELRSDLGHEDYQMDLPIPDQVGFSVAGGDYSAAQQVELTAPKGTVIYYTLDGSEPTEQAIAYSGPIHCGLGVTRIRTTCYSDIGVAAPTAEATFRVAAPSHATTFGYGEGYSGFYYDYGAQGNTVFLMDKHSGETQTQFNDNAPTMLCEYGDGLYYVAAGGAVKRYDLNTAELQHLADVNAKAMLIALEGIYYTNASTGYLYRMDMDGKNSQSVLEQSSRLLDRYGDTLYFVTGDGIFSIAQANAAPALYFAGEVSAYALSGASLFYLQGGSVYEWKDGQTEVIGAAFSSEDREEPSGFNYGSIQSYEEVYTGLILRNRTLYLRTASTNSFAPINWLDRKVVEARRSTDRSVEWSKLNLDDRTTTYVSESANLYVMDAVVITEQNPGVWTKIPATH